MPTSPYVSLALLRKMVVCACSGTATPHAVSWGALWRLNVRRTSAPMVRVTGIVTRRWRLALRPGAVIVSVDFGMTNHAPHLLPLVLQWLATPVRHVVSGGPGASSTMITKTAVLQQWCLLPMALRAIDVRSALRELREILRTSHPHSRWRPCWLLLIMLRRPTLRVTALRCATMSPSPCKLWGPVHCIYAPAAFDTSVRMSMLARKWTTSCLAPLQVRSRAPP